MPKHQNGWIHSCVAGVQTTLADHTAGVCGTTIIDPDKVVLTSQITMNLIRPAMGTFPTICKQIERSLLIFLGKTLKCVSTLLKPGKTLILVESEVFALTGEVIFSLSHKALSLTIVFFLSWVLKFFFFISWSGISENNWSLKR
jgi:acyl-coenzyme A thioesterase PaaI-like protein